MLPDEPAADGKRDAQVHALIDHAVKLFDHKRYREALALCEEVARLDPSAAMPDIMRDACRRALWKRRTRRLAAAAGAAIVVAGAVFLFHQLRHIRADPPAGPLQMSEAEEQRFAFHSGLRRERGLAFAWSLLARDGQPAPEAEQTSLRPGKHAPWTCIYAPTYSLVRAAEDEGVAVRRIVARGLDASGVTACRAEWVVHVRDVPRSPQVGTVEPPLDEPLAIPPGGARTFRVQARDGDGGRELRYTWLVGGQGGVVGTEPAWRYQRPTTDDPSPRRQLVVCRVANAAGEEPPQTVTWVVRLVPSNAPPEFVGFEPFFRDTILVKAGERFRIQAAAHDPDRGDSLQYRWELDGAVISLTPKCFFSLPAAGGGEAPVLRVTVTDSCGATASRAWRVVLKPE